MGLSAKDSRVYWISRTCPISLNGTAPTGAKTAFSEQVLRIEVTPSVYQRKYGHDKSFGAQDVCSGIKSWDGSLTTRVASGTNPFSFSAGDILWLKVYPIGLRCAKVIQGYGVIDQDPIVMNLENGDPVEHNYRFSSKGKWLGLSNRRWGGYECECAAGSGSGSLISSYSFSSLAESAAAHAQPSVTTLPDTPITPVTVYQWKGASWDVIHDECVAGYVHGEAPSAPPTDPTNPDLLVCIVECQAA